MVVRVPPTATRITNQLNITTMTHYENALAYAASRLTRPEAEYAVRNEANRMPIERSFAEKVAGYMEEYGQDHDLCEGWWLEESDEEETAYRAATLLITPMPAPLDEKNVTTDWIENIFDDCKGITNGNCILGFINDNPVKASWYYNVLTWKVLDGDYEETHEVIHKRCEPYDEYSELAKTYTTCDDTLTTRFYWIEK